MALASSLHVDTLAQPFNRYPAAVPDFVVESYARRTEDAAAQPSATASSERTPVAFNDLWDALVGASLRYHMTLETPSDCVLVFRKSRSRLRHFALTAREQRMFYRTLLGDRQKLIAAEASVASSTVANCLRSAMMKLGFRTRLEAAPLAALTLSHQLRGSAQIHGFEIFAVRGGEFVFAKASCPNWTRFPQLTASEQQICKMIIAGKSNVQISQERKTTVGTVQNQVASLFRKMGVSSRFELLNCIFSADDGPSTEAGRLGTQGLGDLVQRDAWAFAR